jgi:hypothetical protein
MQILGGEHATRRRILRVGLGVAGGAFAISAARAGDTDAAGTKPTKFSPEAVQYQPKPNKWEKCLYCTYFQAPNTCAIVSAPVSPQGWCIRFAVAHE